MVDFVGQSNHYFYSISMIFKKKMSIVLSLVVALLLLTIIGMNSNPDRPGVTEMIVSMIIPLYNIT